MSLDIENDFLIFIGSKVVYLCSCLSHGNCILGFQMTRVMNHGHRGFLWITSWPATLEASGIAHGNVRRNIVNTVRYVFWDVIFA